jgi:hypothetical protein
MPAISTMNFHVPPALIRDKPNQQLHVVSKIVWSFPKPFDQNTDHRTSEVREKKRCASTEGSFIAMFMFNLLRYQLPGCGFCRGSCYDLVHRGRPLVVRLCPCWKEEAVQTHSRRGLSGRAVWLRLGL